MAVVFVLTILLLTVLIPRHLVNIWDTAVAGTIVVVVEIIDVVATDMIDTTAIAVDRGMKIAGAITVTGTTATVIATGTGITATEIGTEIVTTVVEAEAAAADVVEIVIRLEEIRATRGGIGRAPLLQVVEVAGGIAL